MLKIAWVFELRFGNISSFLQGWFGAKKRAQRFWEEAFQCSLYDVSFALWNYVLCNLEIDSDVENADIMIKLEGQKFCLLASNF